ncbi:reverse transcriptase domain-containing protein [Tanacetum coccineum]
MKGTIRSKEGRTSGAIAAGSTWPFGHWGIHIIGPLPVAPKGLQFLAIAVEHSTKWIEAKPLTTINGRQVEKFVWEYVVCRFRVPRMISLKEEKHFKEGMFVNLCKGLKITQSFSPVTEHMEIMHHIGKQLTQSQQGWVDNLAKILWIHRTLPRNSEKETPFSLTYGSEAVIPIIETTDDRGRVQKTTKEKENKEVASIEKAYYQSKLRKYHNTRNSHPMYIVGDFVLLK